MGRVRSAPTHQLPGAEIGPAPSDQLKPKIGASICSGPWSSRPRKQACYDGQPQHRHQTPGGYSSPRRKPRPPVVWQNRERPEQVSPCRTIPAVHRRPSHGRRTPIDLGRLLGALPCRSARMDRGSSSRDPRRPSKISGGVAVVSIICKYLPPTDCRGARIKAQRSDHRKGDPTVTVGYYDCFRGSGASSGARSPFDFAAKKLAAKLDWQGEYVRGCLGPDSYVYVRKFAHVEVNL